MLSGCDHLCDLDMAQIKTAVMDDSSWLQHVESPLKLEFLRDQEAIKSIKPAASESYDSQLS